MQGLVTRFFRWRLGESPEYGTKIGLHDLDDGVEEYTEEAFARQIVRRLGIARLHVDHKD